MKYTLDSEELKLIFGYDLKAELIKCKKSEHNLLSNDIIDYLNRGRKEYDNRSKEEFIDETIRDIINIQIPITRELKLKELLDDIQKDN